jgi:hypothetical protein
VFGAKYKEISAGIYILVALIIAQPELCSPLGTKHLRFWSELNRNTLNYITELIKI